MDPDQIKAAIEAIKNQDDAAALQILEAMIVAVAGGASDSLPPPGDPSAENAAPVPPPPGTPSDDKPAGMLAKLTGHASDDAAIAHYKMLEVRVAALTADRDALDLAARQELVAELVKLSVETPATAWQDASKRVPVKRLSAEPVAEMRERIAALRAARPASSEHLPPTTVSADVSTLSKSEIAECKKRGLDPAEYITLKANAVRRIS